MKLSKRMGDAFLLAIAAAVLGGSVPVAAKIALEVFPPFILVCIRFFFATLFFLPFIWRSRELKETKLKAYIAVGFIGALNPILLFIALQYTQASVSPLLYAGVPAMTAIYLYLAKGEKPTSKQILGVLVGLLGVSIVVLLPLFEKHVVVSALQGNILILVAVIAFMFYGIMSKDKQKRLHTSPLILTFYFCLVSLIVSIPFAGFELVNKGLLQTMGIKHVLSGIYLGVVGTSLFYLIYQYALRMSSEVAASLFTYLQPISTILLAVLLLGEKITIPFIIGGVLAVLGARLASQK